MSTMDDWIREVARDLGIDELGEVVDPAFVRPLVLDMTKDVAHGVARPAAPITAYLLGLAVARAAGTGPAESDYATARAEHLAELARTRGAEADGEVGSGANRVGQLPGAEVPGAHGAGGELPDGPGASADAGSVADPAVGSG